MARKFGRRGKPAAGGGPEADPRDLFGTAQPARQAARPASSTPLADQLNQGFPGVDPGYVVLPRSLAEGMSLPWQQQMAALLAQFHQENARLAWPIYRVVPSRYEKLVDLDEEQLAEAGYLVEMDTEGEMIYRERSGRKVEDPANTTVLVSCLDPIPKPSQRQAPAPPSQAAPPTTGQPPRAPAPMNIGPAPVWRTVAPPFGPPVSPFPGTHAAPQAPAPQMPAPQAPSPAAPQVQPPLPQPSQTRQPAANQTPPPPVSAPPATPEAQSVTPPQAEPEPPVSPPATTPPSAAMPPPAPPVIGPPSGPLPQPVSPASPPQGVPVAPEAVTPPRGVPMHRGWFDELAENVPESSKVDQPEGGEFGPTGDPTEIPYRYRK
ncbi:hypothetical protein H074_37858 [Amycolatopsis decaplanina DSM 44594]|uniref:Uncharacterized protein n=1 Tax=Amycolatopsis decaplanina DSM 44594 TaxID=1284240 RepID=M2YRA9_9PSEU|nr:hypothetical protein H074_37858 [Amycolatopsis decaplanina DSM 44594]